MLGWQLARFWIFSHSVPFKQLPYSYSHITTIQGINNPVAYSACQLEEGAPGLQCSFYFSCRLWYASSPSHIARDWWGLERQGLLSNTLFSQLGTLTLCYFSVIDDKTEMKTVYLLMCEQTMDPDLGVLIHLGFFFCSSFKCKDHLTWPDMCLLSTTRDWIWSLTRAKLQPQP